MTTYSFTALVNNQVVTLSSAADVIHFNINKSAGDVWIDRSVSNRTGFTVDGKTIIVEGNMWRLLPSNFLFDGGGEMLFGDRTGSTSADALAQLISGTSGGDLIYGSSGADTLVGGAGNDTIYCSALPDAAVDVVSYQSSSSGIVVDFYTESLDANVTNDGLGGADYLRYVDSLLGSNYGDRITLGGGVLSLNSLKLGGGSDTVYGGTGHALLIDGGGGNDTLDYAAEIYSFELGASHRISVNLGSGYVNDAFGRNVSVSSIENVIGSVYSDKITGSSSDNKLSGGKGNDLLSGSTGNDLLNGGGGADTLAGGKGLDTLTGGTGKDCFRFDTTLNATANKDLISDFSAIDDCIQLDDAIFTSLAGGGVLSSANFRVGSKAADGNDYIVYNQNTGGLYYDADGADSGAAIQFAVIGSGIHPVLTAADFIVV